MPSDTPSPTAPSPTGYRALLRNREFAGLYAGFTLTVAASTLSGFALGTLVDRRTGSPFLTAVSMYGATFATVLGALTLMSVADGDRPRRTLVTLQCVSLAGVAAQAVPGLPLAARFGLLLVLGFFQSLATGTRMGLLAEVVPASAYVPARSLMNITAGGTAVLGFALGAVLLRYLSPQGLFVTAAVLTAAGLVAVATTVREHSVRPPRRPGLRETWTANTALLSRSGPRALLLNLWVPNGLIVGCEALFISYAPDHAGVLLAAGSAGMLLGDLTVGRLLTAEWRRRCAFALRLLLAAPYLLFALHPPLPVATAAVFVSGAGFAATLPLQERLLALTPDPIRGQVQGVESAGRMTWQGIGAALAGGIAQYLTPGTTITVLAAVSLTLTVLSRPFVARTRTVRLGKTGT
ncbi:MFS transporter [Streptomyces viridosporus]|uniref:Integral membrane protein n=1 Tax=Streptomyces viridosporus (strain ATCC 14672 / DSM 40746 / JCM 4963 / KCTC 9882 / NRRL B-12104 / FH 1290) TaxID=566461 RepID=D6A687_STRV1|nr:MFS transporter [Streptomyces viridosporus]EFE67858.1 integral membrane protein [Streptomyces viridosporus ATCC 14672]